MNLYPDDAFNEQTGEPIPAAAGFYTPQETSDELIALGFDAGQSYSFRFPGGADIGAFEGSIDMPADLDVTSPDLADPNLALDFSSALQVAWAAGSPSETVVVTLVTNDMPLYATDGESAVTTVTTTLVTCEFADTGSGTVPAQAMAMLQADADYSVFSAARQRRTNIDAPLNRTDGDGVVSLYGSAGVTRSFYSFEIPDYDDIPDDLDDLLPDDVDPDDLDDLLPDDFDPDDIPDDFDPDEFDPCALTGVICAEGEVCNTDSFPFTCVPAE